MSLLELCDSSPPSIDLADPADQEALLRLADRILETPDFSLDALRSLGRESRATLAFKVAAKLAASRAVPTNWRAISRTRCWTCW